MSGASTASAEQASKNRPAIPNKVRTNDIALSLNRFSGIRVDLRRVVGYDFRGDLRSAPILLRRRSVAGRAIEMGDEKVIASLAEHSMTLAQSGCPCPSFTLQSTTDLIKFERNMIPTLGTIGTPAGRTIR